MHRNSHDGQLGSNGRIAFSSSRFSYRTCSCFGPPSSPFLQWKFDDDKTTGVVQASARKLAAGLWQLRFNEISRDQDLKFNSGPSDPPPPQLQLEPSSDVHQRAKQSGALAAQKNLMTSIVFTTM
ncbi:hypothetical protein ACE6H2_012995 [Prunus campanulata]